MIYLSKPIGSARYIAQHFEGRRFPQWSMSPTGKVADLRRIEIHQVPRKIKRQIAKARHRTKQATGATENA